MSVPTPRTDMPEIPTSPFIPPPGRAREPGRERRLPITLAPVEGWLTIVLLAFLVLPIAWSVTDARWVLGRGELTSFLPYAALSGVGLGIAGAKVGWGRWRTHVIGSVFAGLVLPILVGSVVDPTADGIGAAFRAAASSTVEAVLDLTVRNRTSTQQFGHYLLVLGIVTWATAQFAGYATLGHRRPLGAVFVTGLVLLGNMSITRNDQLPFLVLYTVAALLLLVRLHADEERLSWIRRRIGDPAAVTGLYLRGGSTFVAIAVVGALALTGTAASAPLAGAFTGIDEKLVDIGQSLQRYLPFGGPGTRLSGVSFGPNATITGLWVNDTTPAMEIRVPPGDTTPYYWRAYSYDTFLQNGWTISQNVRVDRAAGTPILIDTGDAVPSSATLRHQLDFTVTNLGFTGPQIFAPDAPSTVDLDAKVTLIGNAKYFAGLEGNGGWSAYHATALVPTIGDTGFTQNKLRVAGTDYPAEIRSLYLSVPKGALGPASLELLSRIQTAAIRKDPYDLARAAVTVMHSADFTYETDVSALASGPCANLSTVECFAIYKRGYCQYYATTMAVLLRQAGVPTRLAEGWLPGTRDLKTGIETILRSNSHAWVEVYFPGYGWYPFDPTGPGGAQPAALPAGPVVSPLPSGTPRPRASSEIGPDRTIRPPATVGSTTGSSGPPGAAYVVVAVLLLLVVGGLAFAAYQRGPRGPTRPESAWAGIARLAGRFGWAPGATQTPYEYAGALGEVLPVARPDLFVVATAKVEVVYGRHDLDEDRLGAVRAAQRRLRVVLLRLALRRPRRRGIRHIGR